MIMLISYVEILKEVFKLSKRTNLSKEMRDDVRMTAKVTGIVARLLLLLSDYTNKYYGTGWSCKITSICICLVSDICVAN